MPDPGDFDARLSAVEARVEEAVVDARAARYLAAAHERNIANLDMRTDAYRATLNAHGVQTDARFDRLETRLDHLERRVETGFAEVRAGHRQIVDLITGLMERGEDR